MFKNKHIIIALIIAPILAIISYFVTDYMVAETPQKIQTGAVYPLTQKPSCRYSSGHCILKNNQLEVSITGKFENQNLTLNLTSEQNIQKILFAVTDPNDTHSPPIPMHKSSSHTEQLNSWNASWSPIENPVNKTLKIVLETNGAQFFGETGLEFLNYETVFDKDFRQ